MLIDSGHLGREIADIMMEKNRDLRKVGPCVETRQIPEICVGHPHLQADAFLLTSFKNVRSFGGQGNSKDGDIFKRFIAKVSETSSTPSLFGSYKSIAALLGINSSVA